MKIIADTNIPFVKECCASVGDVTVLSGRDFTPQTIAGADALLVRSITRVDERLLAGSSVRFVGTATIGFDHVDVDYLHRSGIGFASAPGSNANSAAEYVLAALLEIGRRKNITLEGKSIGVIGVGNVGSRVAAKCEALGMRVLAKRSAAGPECRGDACVALTNEHEICPDRGTVRLRLHHHPHASDTRGSGQDVPSGR